MDEIKKEYKTHICKNCGKIFPLVKLYSYPKFCCNECKKEYNEKRLREFNLIHRNAATKLINENSINGIDYVECPICHEKHLQLTLTHFKRHGYTNRDDIFKDFPNFKMTAQNTIDKNLKGGNNPMSKNNRTELQRKQSSPYSIEHYLKKFNGNEEKAQEALQNFLNSLNRDNWNFATNENQIEYYKQLGYSKEDANKIVKDKHITNGLNYYIKKYGEELGKQKYEERLKIWSKSLQKAFIENGDGRSIQSSFARNLIELICINFNIDLPKKEKYIFDKETNKSYAYDFEYNHKLIEFNGDYWHCNPNIYDENYFNKSKNLYAKDVWNYDKQKILHAEKFGYQVLTIWEEEYHKNSHDTLKKCIEFLNEN